MGVVSDQRGSHHWAALQVMMAELLKKVWSRSPWPGHACAVCRLTIEVNGEARSMKAAVVDGCNITRHPKCKVYDCT